ncbi:hypothetical protein D3C87_1527210 [compost metagenome]
MVTSGTMDSRLGAIEGFIRVEMSPSLNEVLADLDNDLAERATSQVLVGLTRLFEWVYVVDHWTDVMGIQELVHPIKR